MKRFIKFGVVLLIMLGAFIGLTACQNQKAISGEEFQSVMEERGYTVTDITDSSGTEANAAFMAEMLDSSGNSSYNIRFYVFDTEDEAIDIFGQAKDSFSIYEDDEATIKNTESGSLQRYTLLGQGYYTLITRIGNTLLFTDSLDTYKEDIIATAKALGY